MGNQYEEDSIDLLELLFVIRRHILSIAITALLGGVLALLYTMFIITPVFTSTSTMLVMTKETTFESLADLQMGTQLTNDYKVLISSRPVLEEVIFNLNLEMDFNQLRSAIKINNPSNTRIIEMTVSNSDPTLSMEIVNELARVSSEYIGDKMEIVPPKIIEDGIIPTHKTSPSNSKNLMIGILAGGVIAAGFWIIRYLMDDTIKTEEDVEKYFNLPVLAVVPDRKDYINEKHSGIRGKKFPFRLGKKAKKGGKRK